MIYICDFDDSFTYNIYSVLLENFTGLNVEIISKDRILHFLQKNSDINTKQLIILGPGPGHPDQYRYLFKAIIELFNNKNTFLMGICLGHQIIWRAKGHIVDHCYTPIHGSSKQYLLPDQMAHDLFLTKRILVQHYNSLAVKKEQDQFDDCLILEDSGELVIAYDTQLLTYQFHPESIGTTYPESFFRYATNFLL